MRDACFQLQARVRACAAVTDLDTLSGTLLSVTVSILSTHAFRLAISGANLAPWAWVSLATSTPLTSTLEISGVTSHRPFLIK